MNGSTWIQSNWYELGNLLSQVAFLAAGIWFVRNLLRTIRASQEQIGALLKLSITGSVAERHSSSVIAERTLSGASPYWLTPAEPTPPVLSESAEIGPTRWEVARRRVLVWLQAPMSSDEIVPWRKVVRWLQSPVGG
jgi:hypothetical protein